MEMLKKGFTLFRTNRDFTLLMGAQFAAQVGDGLVQTALAKYVAFGNQKGFDLEGAANPQELLRIALYIFVPYTIISPFLGVVIDRWDRRRLLMLANGLRALLLLVVAFIGVEAMNDDFGEAPLFLAFLLTLSSTRVVLATKAAALPATLDEQGLVEGNAVSQLGGALLQLGGAAVALLAASIIEVEPIVIAGALIYLAGAAVPLMMRKADEGRRVVSSLGKEVARVLGNIASGFREVARTPQAGASITTYFWLRFLWSFSLVGIGFIARELLADDDLMVAAFTGGAAAIGAALGFVLAANLTRRVAQPAVIVVGASFVAGAAVAVLGAFESTLTLPILTFFLGLGFFLGKISLDTLVQQALGDDFRGRAFSLYDIAYNVAWVLAATLMKLFWSDDAQGILIAGMGVVFLVGLAGLASWYRSAGLMRATTPAVETR